MKNQFHTSYFSAILSFLLFFGFSVASPSFFAQVSPQPDAYTHVVQKGEWLAKIARQYNTTISEIKRLNDLTSNTIYPGDKLLVYGTQASDAAPQQDPKADLATLREAWQSGARQWVISQISPRYVEDQVFSDLSPQYDSDDSYLARMRQRDDEQYADRLAMSSRRIADAYDRRDMLFADGSTRGDAEAARRVAGTEQTVTGPQRFHIVQYGERIGDIAERYGVSAQSIRDANNIIEVHAGQSIIITPKKTQPSPLFADASATRRVSRGGAEQATALDSEDALGNWVEEGEFEQFIDTDFDSNACYAAHKTLPLGSFVRIPFPDSGGYLEVEVVEKLPQASNAIIQLSPACILRLGDMGGDNLLAIYYD